MITVCAIASGSNGNCYYIGNSREAVLIDAGISARQTINRMKNKQHFSRPSLFPENPGGSIIRYQAHPIDPGDNQSKPTCCLT